MKDFSSVEKMLEELILPVILHDRESYLIDDKLKMTTSWIVIEDNIEFKFSYEKLNIQFGNMQVIVNPAFFSTLEHFNDSPDAYHKISKNVIWESIDSIIKRGMSINVYPILFISLNSCFTKTKNGLANVINKLEYSKSKKQLIISISSEEVEKKKIEEIENAKQNLMDNYEDIVFEDFKISNKEIEYYGFTGCFSK